MRAQIDAKSVWAYVQAIKRQSPLVHNNTNYIHQAIEAGVNLQLGLGNGPIHHFHLLWVTLSLFLSTRNDAFI